MRPVPSVSALSVLPSATPLMVLLASLALAMLPASIVLVTVLTPIAVTPLFEIVTSPDRAVAVGTLVALPISTEPAVMLANLLWVMAALALISASTIAPVAMLATPVFESVISPLIAVAVGTPVALPIRTEPAVIVANLL